MASILSTATKTAHSLATTLLSAAEVTVGATIATKVPVKEDSAEQTFTFENIKGKNVFVGVPGAFTGTCSRQIPAYIEKYNEFKQKGVENIYVLAVNDVFVTQAWKKQLGPDSPVRFIADDQGTFVGSLGLLFDASSRLGSPRSKRFVAITEGDTVKYLTVEKVPSDLTTTAADQILAWV